MTVVVDASVALKWVLREEGSAEARALLYEHLVAPSLWLIEATNALWRVERQGLITEEEADRRLVMLCETGVTAIDPNPLAVLRLGRELGHPVYDCAYLALAIEQGVEVVTVDNRFIRVVAGSSYAASVRPLIP